MWARARIHLRLSEEEFWKLSPRQLQALYRAHEELVAHQEYCTGIVASTAANFSMAAPKEPITASDFFPSAQWSKKSAKTLARNKPLNLVADTVRCRLEALMIMHSERPNG